MRISRPAWWALALAALLVCIFLAATANAQEAQPGDGGDRTGRAALAAAEQLCRSGWP